MQWHTKLVAIERCLGLALPYTFFFFSFFSFNLQYIKITLCDYCFTYFCSYEKLALFYHGLNQSELGHCNIRSMHMLLLILLSLLSDLAQIYQTLLRLAFAMMYQDRKKNEYGLLLFRKSIKKE